MKMIDLFPVRTETGFFDPDSVQPSNLEMSPKPAPYRQDHPNKIRFTEFLRRLNRASDSSVKT
jgi:hypothetical protein